MLPKIVFRAFQENPTWGCFSIYILYSRFLLSSFALPIIILHKYNEKKVQVVTLANVLHQN